MTNKELLEKAAKAYGLFNHKYCEAWKAMAAYDSVEDSYYGESWNPLQDDGDALRLAVKLGLTTMWFDKMTGRPEVVVGLPCDSGVVVTEPLKNDPLKATRRAITRAAVTIYENS